MPYTTNPQLPYVRMEAIQLLQQGWSTRKIGRHLGYAHSTIVRWSHKKPEYGRNNKLIIPTKSSKPHRHPNKLSNKIIMRILDIRAERQQCAEIIHYRLIQEGITVSLSSVKRTLKRHGCTKFSKWKKWHTYPPRPIPEKPGVLVQLDSMQEQIYEKRLYAYAFIDLSSRWAFASPVISANSRASVRFVHNVQQCAPFSIQCIQTDHGSEFSKWFTKVVNHHGIKHRHSRVRKPTDNGHVERFIRTLQEECIHRIQHRLSVWKKEIPEFIHYYNNERPHMALSMKTPIQVVRSY